MQKQPAMVLPGAVQMRIKSSQTNTGERLSQTKSMVLPEPDTLQKPTILKGEYLNKAKIAEGGKKLRKNWTSTWVVLCSNQLLFYKESKQEAVANLKPGGKPDGVDLCGAAIDWTTEKSSRKNVIQITARTSCFISNNLKFLFKLNYSASDSADKNGVKNRLKKFISRRPSMKTLQEKGLIKGLEADGIYRVSGNLAVIQKLRFLVDQEEELDLGDSQWEDVHVITGALKMFFRELPEPLFPFRFFDSFVEAIKIKEPTQKVQALKKLIHQLPKPNHNTTKLLFHHLRRVLMKSQKNLMSSQGISIVFGPTLMWPEFETGNMEVNMVYQNQIVESILIECVEIFGPEGK
ncbi:rho GTPase-activating 15 isoform X1 [Labeo rohita]|uniref:Rho GTPase-activating 15 isoform X1 n=1 Tax=Labeo rohita TaxID=84645 RepID=A0A498NEN6_LABRO|nr:rho GTPase-activating 15 isoform X1 [Labeo rohita]